MDNEPRMKMSGTVARMMPAQGARGAGLDRARNGGARSSWPLLLTFIAMCSWSAVARAEQAESHVFLAADQLLAICDMAGYSPDNPSPAAMLYLMGVVDSEALAPARSQDPIFCVPDGTGQSTLAKVVCQYVRDHMESRRYTAASLTYAALRSSFPCR